MLLVAGFIWWRLGMPGWRRGEGTELRSGLSVEGAMSRRLAAILALVVVVGGLRRCEVRRPPTISAGADPADPCVGASSDRVVDAGIESR